MSTKDLFLENQICFPLYACSRALTSLYRPILDQLGLTYPQYLVLLVLWKGDGCSVKEIGRKLYLDSGTLTPLLKRLEDSELVVRKRSEKDERSVRIFLSLKGKKLKERAVGIPSKLLEILEVDKKSLIDLKNSLDRLWLILSEKSE
ncbi:MarR family winged helix-turn-helix transcriptional regulator [Leptospira borgpetersenii]|uniref:Organic hydroperoxide resistance transcriptional regulator n=1 Tax=Leptospira borgpetersenii serovar Ballum TaxID=280505 RepID=A0A0E3BTF2_LEPBO|nr:MarR family transcriptional regulator [Leptospira borgpetersenii]EMO08445.1 organic hydroperoxide resistance transcriptional regulator [Leptospira borgpetersenii str. Noumea 25]ALO28115.1 organic hydroperoxide resistance transcriptional regulator [Leptospira borgpetersenii serovar Ballum]ANH02253.2 Organic hydroperoxide resistance transcriptional regulator [Leptospira borgpetersenii str. 4E]EKR00871.1 organic hydroperoxide resistance transcriptional regulator [Leptospira borgpetersenii serov